MLDLIFTIGFFDKFHKGHIMLLKSMRDKSKKLIVGLYDDKSFIEIKNLTEFDSYDTRKKNIENYADDVFKIEDMDPKKSLQKYISKNITNYDNILSIKIGSSKKNNKTITNNYKGELFFISNYNDKFKYSFENNSITIIRIDKNSGWGQNLIAYKKNWCFIMGDNKKLFPSIDYVNSIMPIKYIPTIKEISTYILRNYKYNKVGLMNYLLETIVNILNENNIPYYLDCGTLLGCIRENGIMKKDTDIDITIHLSSWDELNKIDFSKYQLIKTRTLNGFPHKEDGNMISLKTNFSDMYCDIYTNPAFPQLSNKNLNGKQYCIPINSDLYLTQLYGNWRKPSGKHASTKYHRGKGLVNSNYSKHWDKNFKIYKCIM